MNIEIGSIVGDYQIIGVLGEGGMGKVFKVRNTISDRMEAMKILLPDLMSAPDLANRFLREIKVQASLDHPNIAALRTAVRFENQLLMIMELVEGVTLESKLKKGPLPVAEAVDCVSQALSALSYAHAKGVVHRDIKPANMMRTPAGVLKLMDFGIAKNAADRKLTMTGMTMGSLYYMSPEQIQGSEALDARADLYSLGISLYELVTGKRPFDGDSQFAIMSAHLKNQPVPPITLDPTLPAALNDVILFSVEKDPAKRFQTADAFRNALLSVMSAPAAQPSRTAVTATIPPPVAAAAAPAKSRRGLWVAAGAFCAVAAVIGVIELAPKKQAEAGAPGTAPAAVSAPAPAAVQTTPEATPPPVEKPAHQEQVGTAQPQRPPVVAPKSTPVPAQPKTEAAKVDSAERPQTAQQQTPAPPQAPIQQPQTASPAQPAPAPDLAAKRAELMKVRESLAMLAARAGSIRTTMQGIQRSQAAQGLGMRGDWVQAASMMESFLKAANDASNASDTAAAQDFMNKAERQIEKLETAFNK